MDRGDHEAAEIPMSLSNSFPPILDAAKCRMMTAGGGEGGSNGIGGANNNGPPVEEIRPLSEVKVKKPARYRECQKNHAASLGGYAIDGCGEFMPSGEEGTIEALKCAACDCHRNFHRREVEGEPSCPDCLQGYRDLKRPGPLIPPLAHGSLTFPSNSLLARPPSQMIMALSSGPSESDDLEGGLLSPQSMLLRKRFRTKFSAEQKEKMLAFAEKLGWKIQKHDEAAVQQFCADIGVKRHVLKVWMHNNKNSLGGKKV